MNKINSKQKSLQKEQLVFQKKCFKILLRDCFLENMNYQAAIVINIFLSLT